MESLVQQRSGWVTKFAFSRSRGDAIRQVMASDGWALSRALQRAGSSRGRVLWSDEAWVSSHWQQWAVKVSCAERASQSLVNHCVTELLLLLLGRGSWFLERTKEEQRRQLTWRHNNVAVSWLQYCTAESSTRRKICSCLSNLSDIKSDEDFLNLSPIVFQDFDF